jgi:membrane protein DedA with SNARE-associated domain
MTLQELVSTYGYAAVAVGSFLEGETVLILGGFSAHRGYLQLPWVLFSAFIGSLLGDQFYYYLGRFKGKDLLEKKPNWKARSEKVFDLMHRHQVWLILGFRFVYGLRTATPFIIGSSRISPYRFLLWNTIGAALWAIVIGVAGYLFGYTLEIFMGNLKKYEIAIFVVLIVIGILIWFVNLFKRYITGRHN